MIQQSFTPYSVLLWVSKLVLDNHTPPSLSLTHTHAYANNIHLFKNKGEKAIYNNQRHLTPQHCWQTPGLHPHEQDHQIPSGQCRIWKTVWVQAELRNSGHDIHHPLPTGEMPGAAPKHVPLVQRPKAFDTISRPGLWSILLKLGCPPKLISMVQSLHGSMMARVTENGNVFDPFPVTNGVKQDCVLVPTLFNLLFAEMLSVALAKTSVGTTICYRTDGCFFDQWRLKANTKVQVALVCNFLFAVDCALAAHSEEDLQCLADCFSTAVKAFGLTKSIKKTEGSARQPRTPLCQSHLLRSMELHRRMSRTLHTLAVGCPHLVTSTPKSPVNCPRPAAHLGACGHGFGMSTVSPRQQSLLSTVL